MSKWNEEEQCTLIPSNKIFINYITAQNFSCFQHKRVA